MPGGREMTEENKRVADVMAQHPAKIRLGTEVSEVAEVLLRLRMTGLPVVDADMKVVGFVSEQDCLRSLLVSSYHDEGRPRVDDIMNPDPYTVQADASVVDIANLMLMQKPKIYPVVDQDMQLVGLIHRGQVLAALKR